MKTDTLADALTIIMNAEKTGKSECIIKPASKQIKEVLRIMKEHGYIGDYEFIENNRGGIFKVKLIARINKCCAIKPRFSYTIDEIEKFEKRYLPAKDFGIIIVSTNKGMMTHLEAKNKKLGGVLIAYVY
ncbi:MAG: 30S ribosomal protein S8 [Candidatus Parvarchaeota archaeon]|nr:30S ribosomal protein S8 [Candidatus Jingweiarchaeum tengchongense]MCW1297789.1 30S ribosomal protein S8 [Candidatus Jingweiarchaeum tengchongense]MCW1299799.1 30S ribosomal protein S8 [Candidatus Jingweiarchaeum tengchongense]MCW1304230.1 30S ribosomal protein S8 [Candidatus Jingweiarchaeum tengchongense]MCW1305258.1 30S ribosomal protein S8 [Candidatus Jingweiarchaeum tengchongense]